MTDITEAYAELWEMGEVCEMLLDENQMAVVNLLETSKSRIICSVMSRRAGKSFLSLTYATERCIKEPNSIVTFVAPEKAQAKEIADVTMREILQTCPEHLKPRYNTQTATFTFNNGSVIQLRGNNKKKIESARGPRSTIVICDEVGFWDDLRYGVVDVLLPRLNGVQNGKLIMISTPPRSAGHPFASFVKDAIEKKAFIKRTIWDCPRYNSSDIEMFAEEQGGFDSVGFRREYGAEFLTDLSLAILPEVNDDLLNAVTQEVPRPRFYDTYVSMDLGFKDLTAILFAHYDFLKDRIVIEDEIMLSKPEDLRTDVLAQHISGKETDLWGDPNSGEFFEPYKRISDIDHFVLNDLYLQHGIHFRPTEKKDKEAAINMLRIKLTEEKIIINPKCVNLLSHIKNGTWKDRNKKDFDRSADHGHYDFIDALVYLVRNVSYSRNPYPPGWDFNLVKSEVFYGKSTKQVSSTTSIREGISRLYSPKKRR